MHFFEGKITIKIISIIRYGQKRGALNCRYPRAFGIMTLERSVHKQAAAAAAGVQQCGFTSNHPLITWKPRGIHTCCRYEAYIVGSEVIGRRTKRASGGQAVGCISR